METELKSIRMELMAAEADILLNHLTEFISGSHGRILRLTNKKFELTDSVLAAIIGLKYSSLEGWQKVPPYFNANHWQLVREFHDLERRIEKMEYSNVILDKINEQLHCLSGDDRHLAYESYHPYQALKWKHLSEKYLKLNAVGNESELKEVFKRFFQTG